MFHRSPYKYSPANGLFHNVSVWLNGSSVGRIVYLYEKVRLDSATGASGKFF